MTTKLAPRPTSTPDAGDVRWCAVCCSDHPSAARCPGDPPIESPERHTWRVNVHTPRGIEAYGVLVAPAGDRWRARVITYPRVLWLVPGGAGTLKFFGRSAEDAERQASRFVRDHCHVHGYTMRDELAPVDVASPTSSLVRSARPDQLPRFFRALPVRFGANRPTLIGLTGDLSEGGMFIITERPASEEMLLGLLLQLEHMTIPLRGSVMWVRRSARADRPSGMGVKLHRPPDAYVSYVRALG